MNERILRMIPLGAVGLYLVLVTFGCNNPPIDNTAPPDLIVTLLTANPASGKIGDPITVATVTSNKGLGNANSSMSYIYLCTSTNGLTTACLWATYTTPFLLPGKTSYWQNTLTVPSHATPPGSFYVIDVANAAGTIVESTKGNNSNSIAFTVTP
jgi:hypothetical protein